ncbi:MAG: HNH endonuclease [Polyangia bacterium]
MTPFRYPKAKHTRREQPPQYQQYRTYKPFLRREFERKCIYCRLPDTLKGKDSFGVEHYRPKQHFPELEFDYDNLFYACNCCNSRKGAFWPTQDQLARGEFIPNPCDHVIFKHLRYSGAQVEPRTAAGELCWEVLDLNDEDSVAYREFVIGLIKSATIERGAWQQTLEEIDAELANSNTPPDRVKELDLARPGVEADLQACEARIARLLGESD